ncbi:MAG: transcriptional regulator, family [Rhizobacter sp.]|nr:transcriptional regulator, family [Rhizobacter sp.]
MDYPLQLPDQLTPYLKSLRKEHGLSQAQLGQMVGVGQARMADIENNPGSVSVDQMMKVLAALDARLFLRQWIGAREPTANFAVRSKQAAAREKTAVPGAQTVAERPAPGSDKLSEAGKSTAAKKSTHRAVPKGSW